MKDTKNIYISDIIISVDNNEWYYGQRKNVNDKSKKKPIFSLLRENEVISEKHLNTINSIFQYIQIHERDTLKKKRRSLYVDITLLTTII